MKQQGRKTSAQKVAASKPVKAKALPDFFESPESSNILRGLYTAQTQELVIVFKPKVPGEPCRSYSYRNVPESLWKEFKAEALSKGKFFAFNIKPYYPGVACE